MNTKQDPKNKIILALDVPDVKEAYAIIADLGNNVGLYKIGLQLFTAHGPEIVKKIQDTGTPIFLDLKFHDIPNTVQKAVESACQLDVQMLTIHLSGGLPMAKAAVAGLSAVSSTTSTSTTSAPCILGVTVLTSTSQEDLASLNISTPLADQVVHLAKMGKQAGIGGIVASPLEIQAIRQAVGPDLKIVTPGVRPTWAASNDQQRIMTPDEALAAGADYLVIGRPITAAPNRKDALDRILDEIHSA